MGYNPYEIHHPGVPIQWMVANNCNEHFESLKMDGTLFTPDLRPDLSYTPDFLRNLINIELIIEETFVRRSCTKVAGTLALNGKIKYFQ